MIAPVREGAFIECEQVSCLLASANREATKIEISKQEQQASPRAIRCNCLALAKRKQPSRVKTWLPVENGANFGSRWLNQVQSTSTQVEGVLGRNWRLHIS